MSFRLKKKTKHIVNITAVNYKFKLRRAFIKPSFFIMIKKSIS